MSPVCNDTQVVEATFSAIKCLSKSEFGNKIPTLSELIMILPKILDHRNEERQKQIYSSRLVIFHKNPKFRIALEKASWVLNAAGMRLFHEAIMMSDNKRDDMKIENCEDGEMLVENYRGRNSSGYVGRYKTTLSSCNCSWYASRKMCRHMIYYRDINCVPVFDIKMMHKSLVTKRFQSEAIGEIHEDSSDDIQDLNESVDMFNDEGGANSRLASPGMEHLLEEQQEANKRIPKNVKFNRAFDIAKVTAEYMKDTGTEQFEHEMLLEILENGQRWNSVKCHKLVVGTGEVRGY